MLITFEHNDAGALPHHEAVAITVIGPRGARRVVVEMRRQRFAGSKPCQSEAAERALCSACDHHIGIVEGDQPCSVPDGMRARRAGRDHGMIRPFQTVLYGHVTGREIDKTAGNEKRTETTRPLFMDGHRAFLDPLEAADA